MGLANPLRGCLYHPLPQTYRGGHILRVIICKECGEERLHHAHGLCGRCYTHRYREAHQEEILESYRKYHEAHREERNERYRQRYRANPEKYCEKAHHRCALKNSATVKPVDEAAIYERDGYMCLYCGSTHVALTIDHIEALNNGGPHCQDNLLVACGRCNSSKGVKPLEEWLQTQPRALVWVM